MKRNQWILVSLFALLCIALVIIGYKDNLKNKLSGTDTETEVNESGEPAMLAVAGVIKGVFDTTIIFEAELSDSNNKVTKEERSAIIGSQTKIVKVSQVNSGLSQTKGTVSDLIAGTKILVVSDIDIRNIKEINALTINIIQ